MTTASGKRSFTDPVPGGLPEELLEVLDSGSAAFRIERIVSRGHASPPGFWYDQDEDEWVWLFAGAARLEIESPSPAAGTAGVGAHAATGPTGVAEIELAPGDYLLLPAHTRHRVSWTAPDTDTVWLTVFLARGPG